MSKPIFKYKYNSYSTAFKLDEINIIHLHNLLRCLILNWIIHLYQHAMDYIDRWCNVYQWNEYLIHKTNKLNWHFLHLTLFSIDFHAVYLICSSFNANWEHFKTPHIPKTSVWRTKQFHHCDFFMQLSFDADELFCLH